MTTTHSDIRSDPEELRHLDDPHDSHHHDAANSGLTDDLHHETERDDAVEAGAVTAHEIDDEPDHARHKVPIEVGCDVVCRYGEKLGEVVDIQPSHVVIEKGFFVPEDWYVPTSAIASVDAQHVTLNVTRDQAEHAGWDHDPED